MYAYCMVYQIKSNLYHIKLEIVYMKHYAPKLYFEKH